MMAKAGDCQGRSLWLTVGLAVHPCCLGAVSDAAGREPGPWAVATGGKSKEAFLIRREAKGKR